MEELSFLFDFKAEINLNRDREALLYDGPTRFPECHFIDSDSVIVIGDAGWQKQASFRIG